MRCCCPAFIPQSPDDAPAEQQRDHCGVDRHLGVVALRRAHPEEVQQPEQRDRVDRAVKRLPARRAERLDRPVEGGQRQRRHQQQRAGADEDERALRDVVHDVIPDQPHVEPAVAQEVHTAVEECEQTQHAPKARERGLLRDLAQRRHGQRDAQEAQGPVAGGADQLFGRVGAEQVAAHGALDRAIQQPRERQQAQREQQRFGPGPQQHRLGAAQRHGRTRSSRCIHRAQKFFVRSRPAYSCATCGP